MFVRVVFQNARHDEAWMILRQVHDTNWKAKGEPERVFNVSPHLHSCLAQSVDRKVIYLLTK